MFTALDALLTIQGNLLLHGNMDGAGGVEPATALGDLRGSKAVVYGECSYSSRCLQTRQPTIVYPGWEHMLFSSLEQAL